MLGELLPAAEAARLAALHGEDDGWRSYTGHEAHDPAPEVDAFLHGASERVIESVGRGGK